MVKKLRGKPSWLLLVICFAGGCSNAPVGGQSAESAAQEPPLITVDPTSPATLRAGHPQSYTIVPGDTLSISYMDRSNKDESVYQVNGDGMITMNDARQCVLQCDLRGCATP